MFYIQFSFFPLKLRCKNGSNYKLQASDNIHIKISQVAAPRTVLPHAVEPAKMIGEEIIKVSFTARLAGGYAIDIRINGLIPTPNSRTITRHYKAGQLMYQLYILMCTIQHNNYKSTFSIFCTVLMMCY